MRSDTILSIIRQQLNINEILLTARFYIFNRKYLSHRSVVTYRNSVYIFVPGDYLFLGYFCVTTIIAWCLISYNFLPPFPFYVRRSCSARETDAEKCKDKNIFIENFNQVYTAFWYSMFLLCMTFPLCDMINRRRDLHQRLFTDKFTRIVDDLLADNPAGVLMEFGNRVTLDTLVPIVDPEQAA